MSQTARRYRLLQASITDLNAWAAARERQLAAEHLARMTPEQRAELEREWRSDQDIAS